MPRRLALGRRRFAFRRFVRLDWLDCLGLYARSIRQLCFGLLVAPVIYLLGRLGFPAVLRRS